MISSAFFFCLLILLKTFLAFFEKRIRLLFFRGSFLAFSQSSSSFVSFHGLRIPYYLFIFCHKRFYQKVMKKNRKRNLLDGGEENLLILSLFSFNPPSHGPPDCNEIFGLPRSKLVNRKLMCLFPTCFFSMLQKITSWKSLQLPQSSFSKLSKSALF